MAKFLVGTGIVLFPVEDANPYLAIEQLKRAIRAREHQHRNEHIGMSLVNALKEGRLNFIVFDAERTTILAGEYRGEYQEKPTRELADSLRSLIPDALYYQTPCTHCPCGCTDNNE